MGCVSGAVSPAAITTEAGETVSFVVSVLTRLTVTPPAGAGVPRLIGNDAEWPGSTERLEGSPIVPACSTVTLAAVSGINGSALTWITAVPAVTPVTGMERVEGNPPFGRNVKVCEATVATPVLLEVTVTLIPPTGALPESVSVKFCVEVPTTDRLGGLKVTVAVTCAGTVAVP
jgi:hypothetical protein